MSGPALPDVTCIVPVRNGVKTVAAAVSSCLTQEYGGNLEVVVADAHSEDGTRQVIQGLMQDHPNLTLVNNDDKITPSGLNAAIAAAKGSIIVRCDAHAILPEGYVMRAVEGLRTHNAANVGGVQRARGTTFMQKSIALAMSSRLGVGNAQFHYGGEPGPTDTVYLGTFDRAAIEEVGLFDETMIRNQDYELNYRLREAGHTVWFDPALEVTYTPRASLGALARQYFEYGVGKRGMVRRHPASVRLRQLAPPLLVIGIIISVALALAGQTAVALAIPGLYLVAVLAGTIITAIGNPSLSVVGYPATIVVMHLCWGAGFLIGSSRLQPADRSGAASP